MAQRPPTASGQDDSDQTDQNRFPLGDLGIMSVPRFDYISPVVFFNILVFTTNISTYM